MFGKLITLDGIDGSGKSTQIDFIRSWFENRDIELIITREPGGTMIGEKIRSLLLDIHNQISLETEALLIFAARQQHLQEIIFPALKDGKWVLSDRFTDATYAYQGAGKGLSYSKIQQLENWVQGDFRPELTILLDIPVEIFHARVAQNGDKDRFESENKIFFEKVRAGYLQLKKEDSKRYHVISGCQSVESISHEIAIILDKLVK